MPVFRILGDLEVVVADGTVAVTRAKQRALLAVLILAAGETVSVDHIADGIWGGTVPTSARELVRLYVAQLREALGEDVIATRQGGYALLPATETDVARFRSLLDAARSARESGDLEAALALDDEALGLWRGRVLADTPVEGDTRIEADLLEELRLTAVEERFEVALALGAGHDLVAELERSVAAQPARERLRAALMLALYRSGRQTEALAVYREARQHLSDEYGLEPGGELRELERAILRHDPALATPRPRSAMRAGPRWRRRPIIGAVALGAAAAALGTTVILLYSTSGKPHLSPGSIALFDARTGKLVAAVPTSPPATAMTAGDGLVFVGAQTRTLTEVDSTRMRVVRAIGLPAIPHAVAFADHGVWVANGFDGTLTRVGLDGYVSARLHPEPRADGRLALATTGRAVWVGSQDNVLSRIDPDTQRTATAYAVQPEALVAAFGSLWVAQATRVTVRRVDARTGRGARLVPLGTPCAALAAGAGSIWALSATANTLWRIDPRTDAVRAAITTAQYSSQVIAHGDLVWVVAASTGTLQQIDPRHDAVSRTIHLERPVGAATIVGNRIWAAIR
jgi:DNA-binding SARP family transcriptional activator